MTIYPPKELATLTTLPQPKAPARKQAGEKERAPSVKVDSWGGKDASQASKRPSLDIVNKISRVQSSMQNMIPYFVKHTRKSLGR